MQPERNIKDTTAFKRLQRIPETSEDSKCISYRTKSTSFGCFSWEPAFHLKECQSLIDRFWFIRSLNPNECHWPSDGTYRCERCARPFKTDAARKTHRTRKGACSNPKRNRTKSLTDEYIRNLKREQIIENDSKNVLTIGDEKLKMVPEFVYLGHLIRYDGDKLPNLKRRIKKAQAAFGLLFRIWSEEEIDLSVKILAYTAFVVSIFTYGSESWILDDKTKKKVINWNAKNISLLTNNSIHEESKHPTLDVLTIIRKRRADWLRISFTNDPNEPITKSLHYQNLNRKPGDIFSDFEHKSHDKMMELLKREDWKEKLLPKELH